jgi:integrase/recombinase XerD
MRSSANKQLAFINWPEQDRAIWESAFRSGAFLDEEGAGAHLAPATRVNLKSAYGRWLGYLAVRGPERFALPAMERVDVDIISAYVDQLRQTRIESAVAAELHFLRLALVLVCPDADWSWLQKVTKRIAARAGPRPKRYHLITSERLYALGLELMDRATKSVEERSNLSKAIAFQYRDGLLIALLAPVPLRRRTLAALRIGTHLVKAGDAWALDIPASDTKAKKALEFPLSPMLSGHIDIYLKHFRTRIPGANAHGGLWASNKAQPMDDGAIYDMVRRRTREAFGFAVNLHRFRHAAATFWSVQDPKNVRGSKDLLGHASFDETEDHYVMGQSRIAGRVLAEAIKSKADKAIPQLSCRIR